MGLPPAWEAIFLAKGMMPREPGHPAIVAAGLPARPNGTGKIKGAVACVGSPIVDAEVITVVVGVKTPNPLNGSRGHWSAAAKRAKSQRDATTAAFAHLDPARLRRMGQGCTISLARVSAGRLSEEAVPGALKHVRDAIGVLLRGGRPGERDDDKELTWRCSQLRGPKGSAGVVVSIRSRG